MPTNASIIHQWGNLPDGYEPTNANEFVQQLSKILTSYLAGSYSLFNYGNSTPSTEDQDKPWLRTVSGSPDRWYVFYNGKWVAKHEVPASGNERRLWVGTDVQLRAYDGGDGSTDTPTETTGAMWEIDTTPAGKFPVFPGDFADSGAVNVGQTATDTSVSGVDKVTLSQAQMPSHVHGFTNDQFGRGKAYLNSPSESEGVVFAAVGAAGAYEPNSDSVGSDEAHNNLPPFYGIYLIKRTSRVYRTIG